MLHGAQHAPRCLCASAVWRALNAASKASGRASRPRSTAHAPALPFSLHVSCSGSTSQAAPPPGSRSLSSSTQSLRSLKQLSLSTPLVARAQLSSRCWRLQPSQFPAVVSGVLDGAWGGALRHLSSAARGGARDAPPRSSTLVVHHRSQPDSLLQEALALVRTATNEQPEHVVVGSRSERNLKEGAVLRSGVLAELAALVAARGFSRVVLNLAASGQHQARVQDALGKDARVTDRVGLVLEIFKQRASSSEARLAVRLADLRYQATRLVRRRSADGKLTFGVAGQEAEVVSARGRGGQGTVGGGGEKELADQAFRMRMERQKIERELEAVRSRRQQLRAARARSQLRTVAIVGYTNAGKSSLLTALCGQEMGGEDKLFATLDTRVRRVALRDGRDALFADTVGFIEGLPLQLVQAFRATLEEAVHADVLVHVIDASSPRALQQREVVHKVLASLGVSPEFLRHHMLEAWNKVDLVLGDNTPPSCHILISDAAKTASELPASGDLVGSDAEAGTVPLPAEADAPEGPGDIGSCAHARQSAPRPLEPEQRVDGTALGRSLLRAYGGRLEDCATSVVLTSVRNKWGLQELRAKVDFMLQRQLVAATVKWESTPQTSAART